MLIWDEKNKEHIIRIVGSEKERIEASDFDPVATNAADEAKVKTKIDNKLSKYHSYIHIFGKPTSVTPTTKLNYIMWLGPIKTEPIILPGCKYWWEHPKKEKINGKNI